MTKEEQIKYFKEKYGVDNIYKETREKIESNADLKDNERYTGLVYDGIDDADGNTNTEPFSPKPHTAIRISGKKEYDPLEEK